ncbi:MAG: CotH kinase family protein [Paludibacteraceae bacterium]|nr:CotH kinase family protein [Paludibacteraceae bacterium]
MKKHLLTLATILLSTPLFAGDILLQGTPIGSPAVDYSNGSVSTTVNQPANAFDGDLNTFYASYDRSYTWVGLDLGTPHVITRVGWSPRNNDQGPKRVQLGMIEGANRADFLDAVPLYLIDQIGVIGQMHHADIAVSKGFRYVRFVGPNDQRCNIAELEFYGHTGEGDESQFYLPSGLPIVIINTVNAEEPYDKINDIPSYVRIIDTDSKYLIDTATTRLRGNASLHFPKKAYRIKFEHKQQPLGAPAKAKKWTLISNHGDKTLMRNLLAFRISQIFQMEYTPHGQFVDVILNGEYKGCYQLCDQIEVNKNRVNIDEMETSDTSGEALTGGYLWEIDAYANQEASWFNSIHNIPVTIKSPDEDDITPEQREYIERYFNTMENDVFGAQFKDPQLGWRRILDAESFLKHFIINELAGNIDTYWSTYQYKKRGEDKIYTGPIWDFDIAFDNVGGHYPVCNKTDFVCFDGGSHAGNMRSFAHRILKEDEHTMNEIYQIWSKARKNGITKEALCQWIDEQANLIDQSQRLNFIRWDILNSIEHGNPVARGSFLNEVNYLKQYITDRIAWMDNKLGYHTTDSSGNQLLTGTPIGSPAVDYSNGSVSTTVNQPANAFDGDLNTFYASYDRSYTWVGLDLGTPHIITRVGWSPRNDGVGPERVKLGMIEGANRADFLDAVPLYIIDKAGEIGKTHYTDIHVSKGFRYVRYVGPNNVRCNIAELEFYGHAGEGDESQFYLPSGLPLVVINTVKAEEPYDKEHDIPSYVRIIDTNHAYVMDTATTRLRGNASTQFPKKPYRIKFEHKQQPLGAPAKAKKWTLINNYGDKTLMRNLLAFHISQQMGMPYTPYGQAVDVILNGEYKGCYQLCDQIEVNKNRVNIDEMETSDTSGEGLTGGYLWEIDAYAYEEKSWFNSNHNIPVTIKSPDEDDITPEQSKYIRDFFNAMEADVYGPHFADSLNGWRRLLDAETFLKHFLIGELSGNTDTYWSVYQYKKRGEDKVYTGPVWDFDIAFDNDYRTYPLNNKSEFVCFSGGSVAGDMGTFVRRIVLQDPKTMSELKSHWQTGRHNQITAEALCQWIDSMAVALYYSQRLNFMRWNILHSQEHMNPVARGSYAAEVNYLKEYITQRIQWMDNRLGYVHTDIQSPMTNTQCSISIWDIMGRLIYQGEQLPALDKGLYIVRHNEKTEIIMINN